MATASFISAWAFVFLALIFFERGDDKQIMILLSCSVLTILAIFSMLIPTYTIMEYQAYNVVAYNVPQYCASSSANVVMCGTTNTLTVYPARNITNVDNTLSDSVITLYTIFAVFQAFIFMLLSLWSFRMRMQYKSTKEFKKEVRKFP